MLKNKKKLRTLRHNRVRARVNGSGARPRLNVYRSLNHIYAQLIDDEQGKTLVAASTKEVKTKANKTSLSAEVGKLIAEKATKLGLKQVVFDRGGYKYHGRIKSLAEAARAAGLEF